MSDLFGIGLSGLATARSGVNTAGNNIANVNTPGYTRRSVDVSEVAQADGSGSGSRVSSVDRQYSQFLTEQLNDSESRLNATQSQLDQVSQIDNMLSDNDSGVGSRIQDFFDSLQTLSASPADSAARTAVLGDAEDLSTRFRSFASRLADIGEASRGRIKGAVEQINNNVAEIDNLNGEIIRARASADGEPNQLLDTRDQLISETNNLVGVDVTRDSEDRVSLTVGGQPLLNASGVTELGTRPRPDGSGQIELVSQTPGAARAIDSDRIQGGEVSGLLAFDQRSLPDTQSRLNQTAAVLAEQLNGLQQSGVDQNGQSGRAMFDIPAPQAREGSTNTGDAAISASLIPGQSSQLTTDSYELTRTADGFSVASQPAGKIVTTSPADAETIQFDGVEVGIEGDAAVGDTFHIRPIANAASDIDVNLDKPSQIAAAQSDAAGDNRNVEAMAKLSQSDIVGGNRTLSENYAQLVGDVGNETASLQTSRDSQQGLTDEIRQSRESVSGVNLDEENVSLMYYQQMYQANSQVIRTAGTLFDTILGITR